MPTKVKSGRSPAADRTVRVGVDTGGTFTDFVFELNGRLEIFKLPSTPSDPSQAILSGLRRITELSGTQLTALEVVHGTTVGTNALLQRRGARTALITSKGFEDVLEIGRQARPELYNLNAEKPPALVPGQLRFGARERIAANGDVLEELSDADVASLVKQIKRSKAEAVAISLLFSFANPAHEKRIAEALDVLNIPLSVSHRILPEYREFERTSTVTINAYLQPLMGTYLTRLTSSTADKNENINSSFRVMQSSGGSISAAAAAAEPVRTILLGPAGGIVGALRAAQMGGFPNVITFDMGGTSTDVALCDRGALRMTNEAIVAGLPVAVPVMDIHTVGAGGGSIARVDEGGSLRVGPESAGADPGPACYGRSFLPTVTDAHVVLRHFGGAGLLGGEFVLDEGRAREAMSRLAQEMTKASGRRVSAEAASQGVLSVVNANMERALRRISVERGYDPRDFALLPFGGAGGLHAVDLARSLRIPRIISPGAGGALSAIGVLAADVVKDQSRTVMLEVKQDTVPKLEKIFLELEKSNKAALKHEGFPSERQRHDRMLAARYKGQSFELELTSSSGDIAAAFHRAHERRYGYAQRGEIVEIVGARVRSAGLVQPLKRVRIGKRASKTAAPKQNVETVFEGKTVRVALYRREELGAGEKLRTPCLVTEYSSTTLLPGGSTAEVDSYGNLIIEVRPIQ